MSEHVAITENEYLFRIETRGRADLYFDVDVQALYQDVDVPEDEDEMGEMLAEHLSDRHAVEDDDTVTWTDLRVEEDIVGGFTLHGRVTVAGKRYDDFTYEG